MPPELHYQLLHRTGSAIIEAERFGAEAAAMVVHSFSPEKKWLEAYALFVEAMGGGQSNGDLVSVTLPSGRPLFLGWAIGEAIFLAV